LERLRELCLALPEAEERETWGDATFRVRDRIFAMHRPTDGVAAMWCKAPSGAQAILVAADPERFFAPPYVGPKGWIGMRLGAGTDWDEVASLLRRSYRMTAPKRLAVLVEDKPA
jgi:predicted DNA-binding protein (MmcQ/YjbR family)